MRLIALAQDREYTCSCPKCKALFAYKEKDLVIRTYPIIKYNWLGKEVETEKTEEKNYVICPNCSKWIRIK